VIFLWWREHVENDICETWGYVGYILVQERMGINTIKYKSGLVDVQLRRASCTSSNFCITSNPSNICKNTIPTEWISLLLVYNNDDSCFASFDSLMNIFLYMQWHKRKSTYQASGVSMSSLKDVNVPNGFERCKSIS